MKLPTAVARPFICFLIVGVLHYQQTSGQIAEEQVDNAICFDALSCGECLQAHYMCAWCETDGYSDEGAPRCDLEQNLIDSGCNNYTMPTTELEILEDVSLRDADGSDEAVQIQPQRVSLKLRAGATQRLRVQVRQARDYPVDLYYVMDLSRSMQDDLEKLKILGQIIAEEMGSITSNFRLGFGSFVDKTVLPYISTVPRKIREPCDDCEAPYSFRNVLPLDNRTDLFAEKVSQTRISGNLDTPEGSLDALMQATVCKNEIGWRDKARHLIVYTSDASFHIAGDGRLGGIVTPSDGRCHLNDEGEYDTAHLYDYPSIGQLNAKMRENNIIPIFAVVSKKNELYTNLTELIEGSNVGVLAADSSNIVDIIKENYALITQQVQVVDTAPSGLELSYTSHCTDGVPQMGSDTCTGLGLGETVFFDVDVRARDCLGNSRNTTFQIQPIGFEEALTVEVEVICSCDCENIKVEGEDVCSFGNGSLVCGECECNEGRYGKMCECSGEISEGADEESEAGCRPANATNVCFGRGECVCGQCVCNTRPDPSEVISGTYCECDNFSCARYQGQLCGGEERGECICDKITRQSACKCKPGYKGIACDCPTRQDSCRARNGLICNAVGNCTCGECQCDPNSRFQGPRCDECATCSRDQCFFHQPCLECKAFKRGRLSPEECDMCAVTVEKVEKLSSYPNSKNCSFVDDRDNCSVNFAYVNDEAALKIKIYYEENRVCARSTKNNLIQGQNLWILIGGIVLSIVLIGIVLALIYRLWTYIQDRKEYAQWLKDQQEANWEKEQNPIYKSNISTFKNPMYNK